MRNLIAFWLCLVSIIVCLPLVVVVGLIVRIHMWSIAPIRALYKAGA